MIDIAEKLDSPLRTRTGQIYYEAFRRKLQPLIGKPEKTICLLTAGLNLDMAIGILVDKTLLGVAGLQGREGVFSQVFLGDSLKHLGIFRGLYAWAVLNLFGTGANCPPDELRIAALAVDAAARGQGLGSRLLEAVFDKARREGYRAVRLEVVDTNVSARRLYERMGFIRVKTNHYPFIRNWLGFSSDHVMAKVL